MTNPKYSIIQATMKKTNFFPAKISAVPQKKKKKKKKEKK